MKNYISILLITLSINVFSQNSAKQLLNEVSQKAKSYSNISIEFKYVLENTAEKIKQETKGNVIMEGNKYKLNLLGTTQLFNGKTLYTINTEDEEVAISNKNKNDEDLVMPSKILTFYENGYTSKLDIVQNIVGRKIQYVKLTPIESKSEIKHILLGIDSNTKHIYNLIQIGKNGTKTTLTVNSFKTNEPLSKTLFVFDANKYKGYYINKLD